MAALMLHAVSCDGGGWRLTALWLAACSVCQDFMGFLHLGWDTATQEELEDEPLSALGPAWEEASRCGAMT